MRLVASRLAYFDLPTFTALPLVANSAAALAVLRQRDRDAVRDRDRAWELEENDPATVRIDDRIQITLVNGAEAVALAHLIASGEISGPRLHIIGG